MFVPTLGPREQRSVSSASAEPMPTVTLTLTDEQLAAVTWEAAAFTVSPEQRLSTLLEPMLADTCRRYTDAQWQNRRRTLERDAQLTAMIDRAGDW